MSQGRQSVPRPDPRFRGLVSGERALELLNEHKIGEERDDPSPPAGADDESTSRGRSGCSP
jgi:hypothetical protein